MTEESDNSREADPEDAQSRDVSPLSSGLEPSGLDHSGEKRESASSVREPETTAAADASERSVGSEFEIPNKIFIYFELWTCGR